MKYKKRGVSRYAKCKRCSTERNIDMLPYCMICKDMTDQQAKDYRIKRNHERRMWEQKERSSWDGYESKRSVLYRARLKTTNL